ncbi:MAG: TAXI family TRAP transporter solute-binding subunit [Chloroflexi bacterium]|nr:TAXI family TRAP transporter solute-binding subunit [Chloroflexota bacterium]
MKGFLSVGLAFVLVVVFLVTACAAPATPTPTAAPKAPAPVATSPAAAPKAPAAPPAAAATKAPVAATPAPATPAAKAPAAAPVTMPRGLVMMAGSSPGSAGDLEGKWWQQQIAKVYPNLAVRLIPGGFNDGAHAVEVGDADIGLIGSDTAQAAWEASIAFFKTPHKRIRALYARSSPGTGIEAVVLDSSPIKQIADLKTRRIGIGQRDQTSTFMWEKALKEVYGFDFSDVRANRGLVYYGNFDQVSAMVGENKADVSLKMGPPDQPQWVAIDKAQPLRWLSYEDKFLKYWIDNFSGYAPSSIFLDAYSLYKSKPAAEQTNKTVAPAVLMIVRDDMQDAVAYEILKAVMADDKGDSFMKQFRQAWMKVQPPFHMADNSTQARTIPFHPGATKYWAEKGYKVAEPAFK